MQVQITPRQVNLHRTAICILAISVLLSLTLIIPLVAVYCYLHYTNATTFVWRAGTVYSTAPVRRLIILGTLSVNISKALVGPLMALHAYAAASDWLQVSSDRVEHSNTLPTPLQ